MGWVERDWGELGQEYIGFWNAFYFFLSKFDQKISYDLFFA